MQDTERKTLLPASASVFMNTAEDGKVMLNSPALPKKKEPNRRKTVSTEVVLAEEILRVSKLPAMVKRFDSKVFSDDFLLALQFQESRFNEKAVSSEGAQGKFQVMPVAIQAVVEYLEFLHGKKDGLSDYSGPQKISLSMAKKIGNLFEKNSQYDKAIGMIYLLLIYDKDYYLNQSPNRDVFRKKSIREQQRLLLYSYQAGPGYRLTPGKALASSREYAQNIFCFMDTIKKLRSELHKNSYPKHKINLAIIEILRKADREGENLVKKRVDSRWSSLMAQKAKENFSA